MHYFVSVNMYVFLFIHRKYYDAVMLFQARARSASFHYKDSLSEERHRRRILGFLSVKMSVSMSQNIDILESRACPSSRSPPQVAKSRNR